MILSNFFLSSRNILCCYNLKKIHLDNHMIICFCSRLWLISSSLYACVHRCIVSFFYNNKLKTIYATHMATANAAWAYLSHHFKNHVSISEK